jgi:hypothetical protein
VTVEQGEVIDFDEFRQGLPPDRSGRVR